MNTVAMPKALVTMTEAGAILGVSAGTIQRAIKYRLLKAYTKRRPYKINIKELEKYADRYML